MIGDFFQPKFSKIEYFGESAFIRIMDITIRRPIPIFFFPFFYFYLSERKSFRYYDNIYFLFTRTSDSHITQLTFVLDS